jgi:hypothetical protein
MLQNELQTWHKLLYYFIWLNKQYPKSIATFRKPIYLTHIIEAYKTITYPSTLGNFPLVEKY